MSNQHHYYHHPNDVSANYTNIDWAQVFPSLNPSNNGQNPSSSPSSLVGRCEWSSYGQPINIPILQVQQQQVVGNARASCNITGNAVSTFINATQYVISSPLSASLTDSNHSTDTSSIGRHNEANNLMSINVNHHAHVPPDADPQFNLSGSFTPKKETVKRKGAGAPRGRRPKTQSSLAIPIPDGNTAWKQKLTCSTCNKSFTAQGSLKRHEITHSGDPQPYACDLCPRKFTQSSTLATHKKEIHEGIRDRFECHVCHQKFTRSSGLSVHIRNLHSQKSDGTIIINTVEKPLRKRIMLDPHRDPTPKWDLKECPICQKTFKKARYCRRHMCIHTGERPFQCPHCDKACYREDDLKKHVESHLDVRKYTSKYCNQSFRRKRNMEYHEKVHEDNGLCYNYSSRKLKFCRLCSETSATAFLFKQHFMEKHYRKFSIPVTRLVINPITLNLDEFSEFGESSSWLLCNTCGNCFTKSDYRLHRVLCDKSIVWANDEDLYAQVEEEHIQEMKLALNCSNNDVYETTDNTITRITTEIDPDDVPTWDDDENNSFDDGDYSFDPVDIKPYIADLDAVAEVSCRCKLCGELTDKSTYNNHVYEKHKKPISVAINKTLFKPLLSTELRSICEVKACDDTFNIPWFMCAKCGRIYSVKTQAKYHKLHRCANKYKYNVVIRETKVAQDRQKKTDCQPSEETVYAEIETRNDKTDATTEIESQTTGTMLDRRIGAIREERWTENWAEDIVLDETKIKYNEIKMTEDGRPQCLLCKKCFKDEPGARAHMIVHRDKKWFCEHCGEAFVWKELYKAHLRKHTGEKPFICRICGKPFREVVGRFVHEKSHLSPEEKMIAKELRKAAQAKIPASKKVVKEKKENKFLCSQCATVVNTKQGLRRHMIVMHPVDGVKPKFFDCRICEKSYSLVSSVKVHLRKEHAGVLPEPLISDDKAVSGTVTLSIENYFVRKNKELKRTAELDLPFPQVVKSTEPAEPLFLS